MIKGMPLDFEYGQFPHSTHAPEIHMSSTEKITIRREISELHQKGAIVPCHHTNPEYISPIFAVPKRDSDRLTVILNLKNFNLNIHKKSLKWKPYSPCST